jgi:hypothetical protein
MCIRDRLTPLDEIPIDFFSKENELQESLPLDLGVFSKENDVELTPFTAFLFIVYIFKFKFISFQSN